MKQIKKSLVKRDFPLTLLAQYVIISIVMSCSIETQKFGDIL